MLDLDPNRTALLPSPSAMQTGLQHPKDLLPAVVIAASLASVTSWAVTGYPTEKMTVKPTQEELH